MANRGGRGLRTGVGVRGRTSGTLSDEEREKSADWEVLWDWMGLNPTLLVYTEREREREREGCRMALIFRGSKFLLIAALKEFVLRMRVAHVCDSAVAQILAK